MQSTLTEPIGPRSPDEILGLVYQRTHHVRRRRRQTLAAAVAVVAMGVAGLVSLRPGDDGASHVRVVDDRHPGVDDGAEESATATTVASNGTPTTSTTAGRTGGRQSGSGSGSGGGGSPTAPPLPTTTTTPTVPEGPSVRLLEEASDAAGDATLPGWYWDIVGASMQLDLRADVVVFTTRYATPSDNSSRASRTLRSTFDYERNTVTVDVTETDNALGTVTIDTQACNECTPELDPATGTLVVRVPIATMNAHLGELEGAGASIENDAVSSLTVSTWLTDVESVDRSED